MTDPEIEARRFADLPTDISDLCGVIQNLLIHAECLPAYDLPAPVAGSYSRETLSVARRLSRILEMDSRPLTAKRDANKRSLGTCRDFAAMLCSMLRHQGNAARVRCGFASYFSGKRPEDHWIYEYWIPAEQRWRRVDAQMDEILNRHYSIDFDVTDLPARQFVTAGEAWLQCRSGRSDPNTFGHGEYRGLWFVGMNVVRDHHAVNEEVVSPWDSWRNAQPLHRRALECDLGGVDSLAQSPEQRLVSLNPPWL